MQQTWLDVYFGKFKWYRKMKKGTWYKHQFTKDAEELNIYCETEDKGIAP